MGMDDVKRAPISESDTAPDKPHAEEFVKAKRWRLIWMLASSFAVGAAMQAFAEVELERFFQIGGVIVHILLIGSWCHIDARERGYELKNPLFFTIIFVTFVGLPIYLIRTRGVRGKLSTVLALLFGIALGAAEEIAIEITYYLM
jgi:hypothetical protein